MRGCSPSRPLASYSRAAVCFLSVLALFVASASAQNHANSIVFYADKQVNDAFWAPLFAAVQTEIAEENLGAASAMIDRHPSLLRNTDVFQGEEFGNLVQARLLGRCDVVQQAFRPLPPGPLGWVLKVRGEIQPYVFIDCTRMAQLLNAKTLGMSDQQRTRAMTEAIAHVLVHEWIHIATQNADHAQHGIAQAQLSAAELTAEPLSPIADIAPSRTDAIPDRTTPGGGR